LRQEFEAQLRVRLRRLEFLPHKELPRTQRERDRLAKRIGQHDYKPEWVFQYRCPRPDCGTLIFVPPSIDQRLQGVLEALLGALRGRFHPPIYTAEVELPKSIFCGMFLGAQDERENGV
jgi:hypothetical protein